jgi:hypothetical protein
MAKIRQRTVLAPADAIALSARLVVAVPSSVMGVPSISVFVFACLGVTLLDSDIPE